ncbi:unnamed protein product, partial [Effrenium voratum]
MSAEGSALPGATSRAKLQETLAELAATSLTGAASAALRRLRQDAERKLGLEVKIEDPALRELFGHLLQVEQLLFQLRQQAVALQEATNAFAEGAGRLLRRAGGNSPAGSPTQEGPGSGALATKLRELSELSGTPREDRLGPELDKAVASVTWQTLSRSPNAGEGGSARYRLERELNEVLQLVDGQLEQHEKLRQQIRERDCWKGAAEQCQQELAAARRGASFGASFFAGPTTAMARLDALQEQLQEAQAKMAALDTDVLAQLLEVKAEARSLVAKPWAALARIRCEFFASMAASWAPVATDLGASQRSLQVKALQPPATEGFGSGGVVGSSLKASPSPSPRISASPSLCLDAPRGLNGGLMAPAVQSGAYHMAEASVQLAKEDTPSGSGLDAETTASPAKVEDVQSSAVDVAGSSVQLAKEVPQEDAPSGSGLDAETEDVQSSAVDVSSVPHAKEDAPSGSGLDAESMASPAKVDDVQSGADDIAGASVQLAKDDPEEEKLRKMMSAIAAQHAAGEVDNHDAFNDMWRREDVVDADKGEEEVEEEPIDEPPEQVSAEADRWHHDDLDDSLAAESAEESA